MIGSTRYTAQAEVNRQAALAAQIAKLQTSVSTNSRMSAASDDPNAAARVADIRQSQSDNTIYARNADTGAAIASATDTNLTSLTNALQRAKELILQGRNDTNGTTDRSKIATELRGIVGEISSISQATDPNGQPLFPANSPIAIPVSQGLSISATTSAKQVFEGVTTGLGPQSIAQILGFAADAMETSTATGTTLDRTDATGATVSYSADDAITASITWLDNAYAQVGTVQTDQGLRAQRFDDAKSAITAQNLDYKAERSGLEDTDVTSALTDYQAKNLALQAAQTMFTQTHKSTLFDLLG